MQIFTRGLTNLLFCCRLAPVEQKSSTLEWLSIGEAAKYLGVSRDTLRRWEKRDKIKSYRTPSGRRKYTLYDLELAMHSPKTTTPSAYRPLVPKQLAPQIKQELVRQEKPIQQALTGTDLVNRPEPSLQPTSPIPLVSPPPKAGPPLAERQPTRLRTLAVDITLILALLAILPVLINILLTLLKGPGEIISPIVEGFPGF